MRIGEMLIGELFTYSDSEYIMNIMDSGMRIQKYNIIWNTLFNAEKVKIGRILVNDVKVIEHIGSTAIPNQYSKPIIDIFVAVYELKPSAYYIEKLGAKYREIKTDMRNRYLIRKTENEQQYNIHILEYDPNFHLRNEILFRDYMIRHKEEIEKYGKIKIELSKEYGLGKEYTKKKTKYIQEIVDRARTEKGLPKMNVWE